MSTAKKSRRPALASRDKSGVAPIHTQPLSIPPESQSGRGGAGVAIISANLPDAKRIADLRHALGLSQEEFGKRLGVTRVAASYWEKGKEPSPETYVRLARLALLAKVPASNALWFFEKAGIPLQDLRDLAPEIDQALRRHEKWEADRVLKRGDVARVNLLCDLEYVKNPSLAPPNAVEKFLVVDADYVANPQFTYGLRIPHGYVQPAFAANDVILVDASPKWEALLDQVVAAKYDLPRRRDRVVPDIATVFGPQPGLHIGTLRRRNFGEHGYRIELNTSRLNVGTPSLKAVEERGYGLGRWEQWDVAVVVDSRLKGAIDTTQTGWEILGRVIGWLHSPDAQPGESR